MDVFIEDIYVGNRLDGSPITLKKVVIGDGAPKLLLGAAVHGDELTPIAVLWKIIEFFRVSKLKGMLTMITGINPEGIALSTRLEPYYNVDMNRVYPGYEDGILPFRIANKVYNISLGYDVVIDMHTAGECTPHILLDPVSHDEVYNKLYSLAESMGITVLDEYVSEYYSSLGLQGSLSSRLIEKGIMSFTLELSGGRKIDWRSVNVGFKALINLMIHLGMVDASKNMIDEVFVLREKGYRRYDIRNEKSGIIENFIDIGSYVDVYMPLGLVRDLTGKPIEWVRADKAGYVISIPSRSIVYPYDRPYLLAVKKD
jgi:hypothetical protein